VRNLLLPAVAACLLALTAPRAGAQIGPSVNWIQPSASHSYVLGDSLSEQDTPLLREHQPEWSINALGGRPVTKLTPLIINLLTVDPAPALVVVELGSNNRPRWTKQKYLDALARLPRSTKVLLVTPYKQPGTGWGPKGVRATEQYARWMEQISNRRPRTCVVAWRDAARRHPEWLRDGLHPTPAGYEVLTRMILQRVDECG